MIGTNRFVYVHQPKTGGTFVTSVLLRLEDLLESRELSKRTLLFLRGRIKHGTCRDIPARDRGLPILGTVRNPYDRYVSQYEFKWWQRPEYRRYFERVPGFANRYPSFPDLTFPDYVRLINAVFSESKRFDWDADEGFGQQTAQFFDFFASSPGRAYRAAAESPLGADELRALLFDVHFLRTEHLNDGLYDYLVSLGCPPERVDFVRTLGRVLPEVGAVRAERSWRSYYTEELKARVRWKERALFELFPEFEAADERADGEGDSA